MNDFFTNVYLILELASVNAETYGLMMRTSKPFNDFIKANPGVGVQLRDSFLAKTIGNTATTWRNGKGRKHRLDGPAVEWAAGYKAWYQYGERHREDGPAVEWASGTKEWWVNGEREYTNYE
jgi:hypothetical protein